jgi:hypothetical protein
VTSPFFLGHVIYGKADTLGAPVSYGQQVDPLSGSSRAFDMREPWLLDVSGIRAIRWSIALQPPLELQPRAAVTTVRSGDLLSQAANESLRYSRADLTAVESLSGDEPPGSYFPNRGFLSSLVRTKV